MCVSLQLSITRKSSSSLDNIYLAVASGGSDHLIGNIMESKENSTYTEAFIDLLITPNPQVGKLKETSRSRKTSAPESVNRKLAIHPSKMELENINESEPILPAFSRQMQMIKKISISADDVQPNVFDDTDNWSSYDKKTAYVHIIHVLPGLANV